MSFLAARAGEPSNSSADSSKDKRFVTSGCVSASEIDGLLTLLCLGKGTETMLLSGLFDPKLFCLEALAFGACNARHLS